MLIFIRELLKELDKKVDTLNKFIFDTKAEEGIYS